jgi:8-amino-7-oxononanoate synthase
MIGNEPMNQSSLHERLSADVASRENGGLLRALRLWGREAGWVNLADNDYLGLARDPAVVTAAAEAAGRYGCSSSASPLISGYQPPHRDLENELCRWHGFASGLVWNSGYSANRAVLSLLPASGDIVFADRLIHNSMIAGILQSGKRLIRFRHNDIAHLGELLQKHRTSVRIAFVVTESVFSMDGDAADLAAVARLKERFPFFLIVDEAHATGWYGRRGEGLAAELGVTSAIDLLVGTCGKALGSQGAYTLFHDPVLREYLINAAGEFIYSTYLSPIAAAATRAAIGRARELAVGQTEWRDRSRRFRAMLREDGWSAPDGDSPIVPVIVGENEETFSLGSFLRERKVLAGVVRPPTVPAGTGRLRFSLRRGFTDETAATVRDLLREWRAARC